MNSKIFPNDIVGNTINERLLYSHGCPRFVSIPVYHGQSMSRKISNFLICYSDKSTKLNYGMDVFPGKLFPRMRFRANTKHKSSNK